MQVLLCSIRDLLHDPLSKTSPFTIQLPNAAWFESIQSPSTATAAFKIVFFDIIKLMDSFNITFSYSQHEDAASQVFQDISFLGNHIDR